MASVVSLKHRYATRFILPGRREAACTCVAQRGSSEIDQFCLRVARDVIGVRAFTEAVRLVRDERWTVSANGGSTGQRECQLSNSRQTVAVVGMGAIGSVAAEAIDPDRY